MSLVFAPFSFLLASHHFLRLLQLLREVLSQASRTVADLSPLPANYSTMATLQVPRCPRYHRSKRVYAHKETHTLLRPTFQNVAAQTHTHTDIDMQNMRLHTHRTTQNCSSSLALQSHLIGASFQS